MNIVSTNIKYNYSVLLDNFYKLKRKYPFLHTNSIGTSVLGKDIVCLQIGNGTKQVCYVASFHANEWITTVLLMKFIEDFCIAYSNNSTIYGYMSSEIFNNASIYIVPMVNPDGVDLVTGNLTHNSEAYINAKNIATMYPNIPFPDGWKANITGESLINFHLFVFKK